MWDSLLSELEIVWGKITYPADACRQLTRYETEIGMLLPVSYREYCSVIGPGELPSGHCITAPGEISGLQEARSYHAACLGCVWPGYVRNGGGEKLTTARFFASEYKDKYFWNTAEVTSAESNEYAIYVHTAEQKVHRLSDTFSDFVMRVCLRGGGAEFDPDTGMGREFRPDTVSGIPPSITVSPEWLTSTVRTLARGIQEESAFYRMPILADALQDAGCDNEELLSHCRHSGGHVRGCWVVGAVLKNERWAD